MATVGVKLGSIGSHGTSAVHGKTSAETDGAGKLLQADVRLPVKLTITRRRASATPASGWPK